jgi:hypothetical protein
MFDLEICLCGAEILTLRYVERKYLESVEMW